MYRVGFPGWKIAAKLEIPLLLRVNVIQDTEAGVYVATSPDLDGLVVEVDSLDKMFQEVYSCVDMLLQEQLHHAPKARPMAAWSGDVCLA